MSVVLHVIAAYNTTIVTGHYSENPHFRLIQRKLDLQKYISFINAIVSQKFPKRVSIIPGIPGSVISSQEVDLL